MCFVPLQHSVSVLLAFNIIEQHGLWFYIDVKSVKHS